MLKIGTELNGLKIISELGRGGMGAVSEGFDPNRNAAAGGETMLVYSRFFPANRVFTVTARFRLP